MDKGPIDGVGPTGKSGGVTSARTSRFSPHVAVLALLALCSTVAALALADNYDRSEKDPAARTAVVAPTESGRAAAGIARAPQPTTTAHQVVATTTVPPSVSPPPALPPATERSPAPIPAPKGSAENAAQIEALPKKPVPSASSPIPGSLCAPEGKHGHTATGDPVICGPSEADPRNRWHKA